MKKQLLVTIFTSTAFAATIHAATLAVDFQGTIMSEQHGGTNNESGPYHLSVNANNAGYAAVEYRLANTNTDGTPFQRLFADPVLSYSFVGGGTNNVLTIAQNSGGLISYTTTDAIFDSFGQSQRQLWTTNDPGANLIIPTTARNAAGPGYRSFGDITASINISGLVSGTVNIFYGAFSARPTVSVVMRDTDGIAPNLTVANAHINADSANRTEYYAAELDFVNDAGYDVIEYTWLANGLDNTGNGRFGGTVLTGIVIPEPSSLVLFGLVALGFLRRRR